MFGMKKTAIWSVVILCFLAISYPAQGCYWYFDKTAPVTELTLSVGQTFSIPYEIAVSAGYTTGICAPGSDCPHLSTCSGYIYDAFNNGLPAQIGTYSYTEGPRTLQSPREIRFDVCGEYQITNLASLKANPAWSTLLTDSLTITVHVPCEEGCTLTPGYWKTHSNHGPAPYDDAWALVLPAGADTPFFGVVGDPTWYDVLWTAPKRGNAYYILAHAYIAAKLNLLNGASSTDEVDDAIEYATIFFNTYGPTSILSKAVRNQAVSKASILDQYNNGYTGPGHCSE